MTPQPLAISHSTVDANALGGAVARLWGMQGGLRCELLSRGVNDYYIVQHGGARYAARLLRHNFRSPLRNRYEAAIMRFYKERGFAVCAPIPASDGEVLQEVLAPEGPRMLSLFPWLQGVPLSRDGRLDLFEKLGAMVAQMHLAAPQFRVAEPYIVDMPTFFRDREPALRSMLAEQPDDDAYFARLIDRLGEAYRRIDPAQVPRGATHNDITAENAILDADGRPTLIDWDNAGEDFFAKELTHFTWRITYLNQDRRQIDAFLKGYEGVRPLKAQERALMPLFLLSRHLNILSAMAAMVNVMGHAAVGYAHSLDRFAQLIREAARDAGLD
jgi:Ser/Thr protein kinase RdoA (MazF antagonist)